MTAIPIPSFDMARPITAISINASRVRWFPRSQNRAGSDSPPGVTGCVAAQACGDYRLKPRSPSAYQLQDITPMRICVFGSGAVGSHFAVRLALAGHDVSCVMRGPHLEAVRAKDLTLRVDGTGFTAHVKASDDPAELGPQDVVVSTLKANSLGSLV